jgi:hypothetical protein
MGTARVGFIDKNSRSGIELTEKLTKRHTQ